MNRWLGFVCAIASAVLYATTINIIPYAAALGGTVMFYLCLRGIFNFGLTFFANPNLGGIIGFTPQPLMLLILGLSIALQGYAYIQALSLIPISIATPLFFLFPVMTYLLQKMLQRRGMHIIPILALCASTFGVWLLAQGGDGGTETQMTGIYYALIAALAQSIANVLLTKISNLNSWQMLRASYLPSLIIFGGYALTQPIPSLPAIGWTALSAFIFFVGSVLLMKAIKLLGAIRTSNIMYIEPVAAILFSVALHSDQLPLEKILAISIILGATITLEITETRIRAKNNYN